MMRCKAARCNWCLTCSSSRSPPAAASACNTPLCRLPASSGCCTVHCSAADRGRAAEGPTSGSWRRRKPLAALQSAAWLVMCGLHVGRQAQALWALRGRCAVGFCDACRALEGNRPPPRNVNEISANHTSPAAAVDPANIALRHGMPPSWHPAAAAPAPGASGLCPPAVRAPAHAAGCSMAICCSRPRPLLGGSTHST